MQLSGLPRRPPGFANHTPRDFEITAIDHSQPPEMFGPAGMVVGAGPLYTGPVMSQTPTFIERQDFRKASSTLSTEDSIQVEEESGQPSRPDSWSIHHDDTTQAPYPSRKEQKMMTTTSLLTLPEKNPSHDLAWFLSHTGPTAPHRRPSKIDHPTRAAGPKQALRFLKMRQRRPAAPVVTIHDRLSPVLRDEGGLLKESKKQAETHPMQVPVEQRQTSSGRRYLALQVKCPTPKIDDVAPVLSPDIVDSRVSISFSEDTHSSEVLDNWLTTLSKEHSRQTTPAAPRKSSAQLPPDEEATVRFVHHSSSPIRPAASSPPTPLPGSAISMAESYRSDLQTLSAKRSFDTTRALSSHPVHESPSLTALPKIMLPREECPVRLPCPGKEVEIKHPSPRRFASHPVLLQRASSIASSLYPRSVSDSPGPPPRSPLRLRRDPRTIENIIATHNITRNCTPQIAPNITAVSEATEETVPIKATVVTDCTGPIKRPRSRGKSTLAHPAYPTSRKGREEHSRARKLRDRPFPNRNIDSVVSTTGPQPRQRLRKPRPQIQIPDLRPAPLVTRASSSASSNASWKKITENTRTPVSPVPSQDSPVNNGEATGYTPISPTASNDSAARSSTMALSPVMLIAEEFPVPKTKSTPKPAKILVKEGKTYAPRPRSASIPRNALKRQSRTAPQTPGGHTPSGSVSPLDHVPKEDTPPLPSPPPTRALPPTPPASGSEKPAKAKTAESKKELPIPPAYEISPKMIEHVASQAQRKSAASKDSAKASMIDARLEALERQNALLSAALMAVLRTNGALNGPIAGLAEPESPKPMAWETRIARRSAASQQASHAASSSNGSALEMYMSTRRGSKHAN